MAHVDHYRNGKKLVSVTELTSIIAKPFLDKWRQSLCCAEKGLCGFERGKQVADEAADLGNSVHKDVEEWFGGKDPVTDWGRKITDIYKAHNVTSYLIMPEATLIDEESGLAGSPDAVIMWNNEPFISDLKIKNQLDTLTGMQGMGYRYLLRRLKGVDITKMKVIHCKKKTVSKLVDAVDIDLTKWEKPWRSLVELWNVCNPNRRVTIIG